jgi:hypothetical protein
MIAFDVDQLERAQLLLATVPNGVERAAASALNRAAAHARTQAIRRVEKKYFIEKEAVAKVISVRPRASVNSLFVSVSAKTRSKRLMNFNVTPNSFAYGKKMPRPQVEVIRGSGQETFDDAFIAVVRGNHVGVFERPRGGGITASGKDRLHQLYGPNVPQMMGHTDIATFINSAAAKVLQVRLDHEISRLLKE